MTRTPRPPPLQGRLWGDGYLLYSEQMLHMEYHRQ